LHHFRAQLGISIDAGNYAIRTASSSREILECCRLRYQVFFGSNHDQRFAALDLDRFDSRFDHLYIEYKPTKKIIGTYRLKPLTNLRDSYTQQEFKLDSLPFDHLRMLEIGRACILPEFRKGVVITLLWRGIAEYMMQSKSDYLIGCSSIFSASPREIAMLFSYLNELGAIDSRFLVQPQTKYELHDFDMWLTFYKNNLSESHREKSKSLLPNLLMSYIKMGAKIASFPALDKDFACVDFLTLVSKSELMKTHAQRFFDGATKDQSNPSLNPTEGIIISSQ